MFSLTHIYKFLGFFFFFLVFSWTSSLPHTLFFLGEIRLIFHLHCSSIWGSSLTEGHAGAGGCWRRQTHLKQKRLETPVDTCSVDFAALDVLCFTFLPTVSLRLLACEDQHQASSNCHRHHCLPQKKLGILPSLLWSRRKGRGWKAPHQDKWGRLDQASKIQVPTVKRKEIISPALLSLNTSKSTHQLRQSQLPPSHPKLQDKNVRIIHYY